MAITSEVDMFHATYICIYLTKFVHAGYDPNIPVAMFTDTFSAANWATTHIPASWPFVLVTRIVDIHMEEIHGHESA